MRLPPCIVIAALVCGALSAAEAQQTSKATLGGIVRDPAGAPVISARVQVAYRKSKATTDQEGRFTIRDLPSADTLQVIVGRIGFRPVHLEVVLVAGDNELTVELEPLAQALEAMRTEVEQSGIFGVVGDTAFGIVSGARASLVNGGNAEQFTNELGQFSMDSVKTGANLLEVRKPGFRPRLLSFMHPPKGGTRLAIWLTPLPPGASLKESDFPNRTVQSLFDFRGRARWRSGASTIITRELLTKYATGMRLDEAIEQMPSQYSRGVRVRFFSVTVDGTEMTGMTLADFNADDVEMVELYPQGTDFASAIRSGQGMRGSNPPQSISQMRGGGSRAAPPRPPAGAGGGMAWIWLRQH